MKGMSDNFILKDGLIMNKCKVQEIKKANKISYGYSKIKRNGIFKTNWEKIISSPKILMVMNMMLRKDEIYRNY